MTLLIKSKEDTKAAEELENLKDEDILLHKQELLEWLQNMNWPVANYVAKRLRPLMNELETDIIAVLDGNDIEWKIWVLDYLVGMSNKQPSQKLINKIKYLSNIKAKDEESLDLVESCHLLLKKWDNI